MNIGSAAKLEMVRLLSDDTKKWDPSALRCHWSIVIMEKTFCPDSALLTEERCRSPFLDIATTRPPSLQARQSLRSQTSWPLRRIRNSDFRWRYRSFVSAVYLHLGQCHDLSLRHSTRVYRFALANNFQIRSLKRQIRRA